MDDKKLWLWLSLHFGDCTQIYNNLMNEFKSIAKIYDSDDYILNSVSWLKSYQRARLLDKDLTHAEEIIEWCEENNVKILTPSDSEYPKQLREIRDYPAVLYCRGTLPDFDEQLYISVVGTRKMSMYGQKTAYELGFGLAKAGALVVSGMALGIDCTAQKGALYAGGSTVAVLGSGIDVCYPKDNLKLMEKIERVGVVLTEYPPNTPPIASNFPKRNRLISALSRATVVVEGDINSGALITASRAKVQGRDLFACPGPVKTFRSGGTNKLISEGAFVCTEAIDVLERYLDVFPNLNLTASKMRPIIQKGFKVASNPTDSGRFYSDNKKVVTTLVQGEGRFDPSSLGERERKVFDYMEYGEPTSFEKLLELEFNIQELVAILTMLEISGAVTCLPGELYKKN